jgi:hypothetical protein
MPVGGPGPVQLRALSLRLRDAGKEGQGLRRELYKAISKAAEPLAREISSGEHLRPYLPDRYAAVLATDLAVTAVKRGGERASVSIRAKGRTRKRKVQELNAGLLTHPVYARGPRDTWTWKTQTGGMRPGFFSVPVREAAPGIRDEVQKAMETVAAKITS